ncbi:hypothetical protein EDD19_10385 [Dietzia cinnamea]|uniref:Uncharacterized protein n=1 Tax=Dietzia cinnamea TaxID=321318 RepID=A0A4R3ZXV4_9ACTN|nr:hypothetical protein EDD19_10385 [Dietzia cinnamea]
MSGSVFAGLAIRPSGSRSAPRITIGPSNYDPPAEFLARSALRRANRESEGESRIGGRVDAAVCTRQRDYARCGSASDSVLPTAVAAAARSARSTRHHTTNPQMTNAAYTRYNAADG